MSRIDLLRRRVAEAIAVCESLLTPETEAMVDVVADVVIQALRAGSKVLLCGNGGSAADAQHLAAEFVGRFCLERKPLAAIALADNIAAVTAIGNDYKYEDVFVRGVEGLGRSGDVLIGLSTSGTSRNVVKALEAGREMGLSTIALGGSAEGTPMEAAADYVLRVRGPSTARIQEGHMLLGHTIIEIAERELCVP